MPPLKPELSDGYVRIVNELFEALYRTPMPSRHKDVVLLIIRHTYGFNRKQARLSIGKMAIELGMARQNVHRTIKALEAAKIITVIRHDDRSKSTYCINKYYVSWKPIGSRRPSVITSDDSLSSPTMTDCPPTPIKEKTTLKTYMSSAGAIGELYNEILSPPLPPVLIKNNRLKSKTTESQIRARISDHPEYRDIGIWRSLFERIRDLMPWLMGKKGEWRANLNWITGPRNWDKIADGSYIEHDPAKERAAAAMERTERALSDFDKGITDEQLRTNRDGIARVRDKLSGRKEG